MDDDAFTLARRVYAGIRRAQLQRIPLGSMRIHVHSETLDDFHELEAPWRYFANNVYGVPITVDDTIPKGKVVLRLDVEC